MQENLAILFSSIRVPCMGTAEMNKKYTYKNDTKKLCEENKILWDGSWGKRGRKSLSKTHFSDILPFSGNTKQGILSYGKEDGPKATQFHRTETNIF